MWALGDGCSPVVGAVSSTWGGGAPVDGSTHPTHVFTEGGPPRGGPSGQDGYVPFPSPRTRFGCTTSPRLSVLTPPAFPDSHWKG